MPALFPVLRRVCYGLGVPLLGAIMASLVSAQAPPAAKPSDADSACAASAGIHAYAGDARHPGRFRERPSARDGRVRHQVTPARRRRRSQIAQRRQLRRVEGQPVPEPPRPAAAEQRQAVTTAQMWWTRAPAGDRRALRPRDPRPRAGRISQGHMGGREHRARRRTAISR